MTAKRPTSRRGIVVFVLGIVVCAGGAAAAVVGRGNVADATRQRDAAVELRQEASSALAGVQAASEGTEAARAQAEEAAAAIQATTSSAATVAGALVAIDDDRARNDSNRSSSTYTQIVSHRGEKFAELNGLADQAKAAQERFGQPEAATQ